jgi:hypothetical protein
MSGGAPGAGGLPGLIGGAPGQGGIPGLIGGAPGKGGIPGLLSGMGDNVDGVFDDVGAPDALGDIVAVDLQSTTPITLGVEEGVKSKNHNYRRMTGLTGRI